MISSPLDDPQMNHRIKVLVTGVLVKPVVVGRLLNIPLRFPKLYQTQLR